MARKTKEEALATRSSILDAAELLFQRQGVSRTSLHDIAQAAGVTRGAVYWHFKDKGDLFTHMMDRVCLPFEESCAACEGPGPGAVLAALRRQVLDVFELLTTDERARRVIEIATQKVEYVDELLAVRDRHLEVRSMHVERLARLVRLAQSHGEIHPSLPALQVALGLHGIVDGLLQNWILDPAGFDLLSTGTLTVDLYLAGVAAQRPLA
jgi:TetR/AcrR family acrAB operon transcriptional repressor